MRGNVHLKWIQSWHRIPDPDRANSAWKLVCFLCYCRSEHSDRTEGHIATGKTSAAETSDSCLSKQKMLPHSGQQRTLPTSITPEINEPPSSGNSHGLCCFYHLHPAHSQQLQLCLFKHFLYRLNNLSLLFCCCFCCFLKKENLKANDGKKQRSQERRPRSSQ